MSTTRTTRGRGRGRHVARDSQRVTVDMSLSPPLAGRGRGITPPPTDLKDPQSVKITPYASNKFDPIPQFTESLDACLDGIVVMDDSQGAAGGPRHTLLHNSIKGQDFVGVQRLISMSCNVNTCCPCGVSHFASAVASGNACMVNLLISSKANVNAHGTTDSCDVATSPLHVACSVTSYDVAKALVEHGADVNARCTADGGTPMHVNACFNLHHNKSMGEGKSLIDESEKIETLLLSSKANIDAQNADGQTPLHVAIRHGVTTMQCFLIRNGADLNLFDSEQRNALICAVSYGSSTTTALLLANRAPVPHCIVPLVCRAASRNGWSIVMQLLNNGANINETDIDGNNAIHYALGAKGGSDNCCRETHIIDKLIVGGCNPTQQNIYGITPLMLISSSSHCPNYKPSHSEYILLENVIGAMYTRLYGPTPATSKEMTTIMNTSWLHNDIEVLFKIKSGKPAYRTSPHRDLRSQLWRIHDTLVSDYNAKEMLACEPPTKNAKQRRTDRKTDELKRRAAKATYLQALLRRSLTPSFAHSNTKECVVCFGLCSTATMPVLAPCGHRTVCALCLPSIKGVCPSCCQRVSCVVRKIYD